MNCLFASLFGKFFIEIEGQSPIEFESLKQQQLMSYLLIYRNRPHPREALASLLWPDVMSGQAKAYLRKALWQLQKAFQDRFSTPNDDLLLVESDWIQINPQVEIRLDVAILEEVYDCNKGVPGRLLDGKCVKDIRQATSLYHGDLLEGWYQEWCLYERERLKRIYLILLDKLLEHSQYNENYEDGIFNGIRILSFDQAHERTHRRLMRLYYLAGDRTEALRQYERLTEILDKELNVQPTSRTRKVYEDICADTLEMPSIANPTHSHIQTKSQVIETLNTLRECRQELRIMEDQIQQKIKTLEHLLDTKSISD